MPAARFVTRIFLPGDILSLTLLSRSLKSSSKVVTVIDLCKKVISTYESEAKTKRWLCDFAVYLF